MDPSPPVVPEPDTTLEPAGFIVDADGVRIHFLDWGGPPAGDGPGLLAIHGLSTTASVWAPVARRIGGDRGLRRFVAMDLRGHGLSDAPTEDGAYDLELHGDDAVAVAEGSGLLGTAEARVVLVGHGHFSRVLTARWIGLSSTGGVRFAMDAPAWTVLGDERGVPQVAHANVGVPA